MANSKYLYYLEVPAVLCCLLPFVIQRRVYSHSMEITIRRAAINDLDQCAVCWGNRRDTYPSIYPLRLADPSVTQAERMARNVRDLRTMLDDPLNVFTVAEINKAPDEHLVVGYMIWSNPEAFLRDAQRSVAESGVESECRDSVEIGGQNDWRTTQSQDPDPECDHTLAAKLKKESMAAKESAGAGKRLW